VALKRAEGERRKDQMQDQRQVPLESVTMTSFKPFGTVLEFLPGDTGNFYIADTEPESGWRVAVFRYTNKEIQKIECHPTSKESFEPLHGITVLLVAEHETPEACHAFILDKPVVLAKGVWHQTLALTPEAQVKITENVEVESVFYTYDKPKRVYLA
jgi:ureidoglycolate hydrolase